MREGGSASSASTAASVRPCPESAAPKALSASMTALTGEGASSGALMSEIAP